jgi:hypothetical protein
MFFGRNARKILRKGFLMKCTSKKVGPYGPFKMTMFLSMRGTIYAQLAL